LNVTRFGLSINAFYRFLVFFDECGDGEAMDTEEATDGADGDFTGKESLQAPFITLV